MRIFRLIALFLAPLDLLLLGGNVSAATAEQVMYVGTHERGIYVSKLDLETGEMNRPKVVGEARQPSFLALHPKLPMLYAVTRESTQPAGGVRSFRIDGVGEELVLVNTRATGGDGATHLAIDPSGGTIVVANYSSGSTAALPIEADGRVEARTVVVEHSGSGANARRQTEPHAHGVAFDASGQFACVADLGTDEVIVYRLLAGGELARRSVWKSAPGAGPRHVAFHPGGRWLYCLNELDSTMAVLSFDSEKGTLSELQTLGTLPSDFEGANTTAEVVVHPTGKFVYGSNRGDDSTAVFAVDGETGRLTLVEIEPTQGGHPRFIGIEPSGKFLIAANRDSDNLVSFRIDLTTGALTPTGFETSLPKPVCVVFP